MTIRKFLSWTVLAAAVLATTDSARAAVYLDVMNSGFEWGYGPPYYTPCSDDYYANGEHPQALPWPITGWGVSDSAHMGQWNPENWEFAGTTDTWSGLNLIHGMLPSPADGFQYGYADPGKSNEGAVMTVQTYRNTVTTDPVGTNNFWSTNYAHLAAGQTYTATMAVGNPIGLGTCNYTLTFGAVDAISGDFIPLSISKTLHPRDVPSGAFVDLSTSYTLPASSPYVGSQMGMMLTMSGFNDSLTTNDSTWGVYDNARIAIGTIGPQTIAWTGTSDTNWSNAANWGGTVPGSGDVAPFNLNGAYPNQPNLTAASAAAALWVTGSGALAISGGAPSGSLTINGGTVNSNSNVGIEMDAGAGSLAISAPLVLGGAQSWLNNSSNPLTVAGNVSNGGNFLTIAGSGSVTLSGNLSGAGGLTVNGGGILVLKGSNTYTGMTTLNGGTLQIANGGQIYSTLSNDLPGAIAVNSGAALEFDNYAYGRCFGTLWHSSANLVINGGTLRYIGSGDTSGGRSFTIGPNGATLDSASDGRLWTIANNDVHSLASSNSGALTLAGAGNGEIDQVIPGGGGLTMNGPGTWTLTGGNTYMGTTVVKNGTLRLANGGQLYSNLNNDLPGAITINSGAALEFDNYAYGACFGTLWHTSANLVINGGTLRYIGSGDTSGGRSFTIGPNGATLESATAGQLWVIRHDDVASPASNSGGMLTLTGAGNGEIDQVIPGGGGLTMNGSGTWTLANNNTYSGDTTVNSGTLNLAARWGTLAGNLIVNDGGTVYAGPQQDALYAGAANVKTVTINAGGLLTLGSQACDLGPTVLNGGTLAGAGEPFWGSWWLRGNITATGSIVSIMSATGMTLPQTQTFFVDSSSTLNVSGTFIPSAGSNNGGIIKTGAGTMILSGSNAYTGSTTVEGGTLIVEYPYSLPDGTELTVGDPTLFAHAPAIMEQSVAVVPEPATLGLLASGVVTSLLTVRLRKPMRRSAAK